MPRHRQAKHEDGDGPFLHVGRPGSRPCALICRSERGAVQCPSSTRSHRRPLGCSVTFTATYARSSVRFTPSSVSLASGDREDRVGGPFREAERQQARDPPRAQDLPIAPARGPLPRPLASSGPPSDRRQDPPTRWRRTLQLDPESATQVAPTASCTENRRQDRPAVSSCSRPGYPSR